jgi:hypothetical protein
MGLRFQKRLKIIPGVTLNLSRKGVSTSIGTTGARVTLGHGQTRTTVGLPGTGISHTRVTSNKSSKSDTNNGLIGFAVLAALIAIIWLVGKLT